MAPDMQIEAFFDPATFTVTYVVNDPEAKACAIIDPVLDFDAASGRTSHASADKVIAYIRARGLRLDWTLHRLGADILLDIPLTPARA